MDENIENGLHETMHSQLVLEKEQSHPHSTLYGDGYFQHDHHELILNHPYDPNMCSTAANFGDSFYNNAAQSVVDTNCLVQGTQPPQTTGSHHSEQELLNYNNAILMHDTTHEIGAETIVTNCETLDEVSHLPELPMHVLQRTDLPEEIFVANNYQYSHFDNNALSHETAAEQPQMPGLMVHRSPNGQIQYQQNYLLTPDQHRTEEENEQYVKIQMQNIDVNDMFSVPITAGSHQSGAHLQSYELPAQYDAFQHSENIVHDNNVEMLALYAADLENVPGVTEPYKAPMERHLDMTSKDEQRVLLESTMSPLLTAVNNITKRDAELQLYMNQPIEKDSSHYLASLSTTGVANDNASDEDDFLLVSDKAVECRAKASLPTNYLYFADIENSKEPSVFAKKLIPRRTRFGPYEGQVSVFVSGIDLDVFHVQTPRSYPVLMIDDNHILDVSNKETSNWMRYIRLAETYAQQNLQLLIEDDKIYLRCARDVLPKEELRVGYHSSYAIRFMLSTLQPTDLQIDFSQMQPQECFQYTQHGTTSEELNAHQEEYDSVVLGEEKTNIEIEKPTVEEQKRRNTVKTKHNRKRIKANIPKHVSKLTTQATPLSQVRRNDFAAEEVLINRTTKKSKNCKNKDKAKCMFKCNLCSKRFHKEQLFKRHKEIHAETSSKPYKCVLCDQECSTPAALTAHMNGHEVTQYSCVFCELKFKYVREFKKHVDKHRIGDQNGYFECMHCKKHYAHYHLVRKHVRIFHSNRDVLCSFCGKNFQNLNALQRHRLTHNPLKKYSCSACDMQFSRKDHLITHTRRKHTSIKDAMTPNDGMSSKLPTIFDENLSINHDNEPVNQLPEPVNDGSQYLKMSPVKTTSVTHNIMATPPSSSNRRKQTPTKLKALELNAETVTFVALPEVLSSPFLISDTDMNLGWSKCKGKDAETSNIIPQSVSTNSKNSHSACSAILDTKSKDEDHENRVQNSDKTTTGAPSISAIAASSPLFPFRCYICAHASFKRRGMLVNHMAKMHPSVDMEQIDVLNAPIVRQELIFPCPYCSNVYKLNAKRKMHIIKHHPGQKLPDPMRRKQSPNDIANKTAASSSSSSSSTDAVASIGTKAIQVHKCDRCHKQYAARSRLVNHYRNAHPAYAIPPLRVQLTPPDNDGLNYRSDLFSDDLPFEEPQPLEPEINIIPYHHFEPAPVSPENKLLKLSSAATLELSRFEDVFLNGRIRHSHEDVGAHLFSDQAATHDHLQHLSDLFDEPAIPEIDVNMEKYSRSIEAQFFQKISKFA